MFDLYNLELCEKCGTIFCFLALQEECSYVEASHPFIYSKQICVCIY